MRIYDTAWIEDAYCNKVGHHMFFNDSFSSQIRLQAEARAKEMCMNCVVRVACLDYALGNNIEHGIWGGVNEEERRRIKRDRARTLGEQVVTYSL